MSQNLSLSRLFHGYISASLIVVYSDGVGVMPKINHRQRKSCLSTIDMQVDVVVSFA